MVASFSNAWPQGREVTSTFTPGLAASNLAIMPLSSSVRCGLVITSISCSVVSALRLAGEQGHGAAPCRRSTASC